MKKSPLWRLLLLVGPIGGFLVVLAVSVISISLAAHPSNYQPFFPPQFVAIFLAFEGAAGGLIAAGLGLLLRTILRARSGSPLEILAVALGAFIGGALTYLVFSAGLVSDLLFPVIAGVVPAVGLVLTALAHRHWSRASVGN